MTDVTTDTIVKTCLNAMHEAIKEAASSSIAAMACIEAGNHRRAFEIALDIEPLLNDANMMLQACSILRRWMNPSSD
jgi:hypothetical protein